MKLIIECWETLIIYFDLADPKSGHYPGAVNIPFTSLFDHETKTLKTVDELKKGKCFPDTTEWFLIECH